MSDSAANGSWLRGGNKEFVLLLREDSSLIGILLRQGEASCPLSVGFRHFNVAVATTEGCIIIPTNTMYCIRSHTVRRRQFDEATRALKSWLNEIKLRIIHFVNVTVFLSENWAPFSTRTISIICLFLCKIYFKEFLKWTGIQQMFWSKVKEMRLAVIDLEGWPLPLKYFLTFNRLIWVRKFKIITFKWFSVLDDLKGGRKKLIHKGKWLSKCNYKSLFHAQSTDDGIRDTDPSDSAGVRLTPVTQYMQITAQPPFHAVITCVQGLWLSRHFSPHIDWKDKHLGDLFIQLPDFWDVRQR